MDQPIQRPRASRKPAGLAALALLLAFLSTTGCGVTHDDFDRALWHAQRGSTAFDNPRTGQVAALERDHLRPGMARAEVVALLGEPEVRNATGDRYALGVSPVGVDVEEYVVEYDADDRVVRYRVRRN